MRKLIGCYVLQIAMALVLFGCIAAFVMFLLFDLLELIWLVYVILFYCLMLFIYPVAMSRIYVKIENEEAEWSNRFLYQILDFINSKISKMVFGIFMISLLFKLFL